MTYKQNTVKVELENEAVIKTETTIIDAPMPTTKVVTIKAEKDSKGVIIVAGALAVVAFVLLGICIRQVVTKPKQELIEMEKKIQRAKNQVEPNLEVKAITKQ